MAAENLYHRPALLGGTPVFREGPPRWPPNWPGVEQAVLASLTSGAWAKYNGPQTEQLFARIRDRFGDQHVHLCSSGTAAVELALHGVHLKPGDEVILAGYDFAGNFSNVVELGARPVLVDLASDSLTIDDSAVESALSPETRGILVSHLHGHIASMPALRTLADRRGLWLVEDAAQMPDAVIHGRPAGTWGDVGVISFGGSKLLSAGRGGALFTPSEEISHRIKRVQERGNTAYPLSELQATVLVPQWDELNARRDQRIEAARKLALILARIPGITPFIGQAPHSVPGYYKLPILYDAAYFNQLTRDEFCQALEAEGVAVGAGFAAFHRCRSRQRFRATGKLTKASRIHEELVLLHHPILLGSEEDFEKVYIAMVKISHWARRRSDVD